MCIEGMLKANKEVRENVGDLHFDLNQLELTDKPIKRCLVYSLKGYICLLVCAANLVLMAACCCSCYLNMAVGSYIRNLRDVENRVAQNKREGRDNEGVPNNLAAEGMVVDMLSFLVSALLFVSWAILQVGVVIPHYVAAILFIIGFVLWWIGDKCYGLYDRNRAKQVTVDVAPPIDLEANVQPPKELQPSPTQDEQPLIVTNKPVAPIADTVPVAQVMSRGEEYTAVGGGDNDAAAVEAAVVDNQNV